MMIILERVKGRSLFVIMQTLNLFKLLSSDSFDSLDHVSLPLLNHLFGMVRFS